MNPLEEDCFWYKIIILRFHIFQDVNKYTKLPIKKKHPEPANKYHFWNFSITKVVPLILLAAWKLPKLAWSREASVSHMMPFLEMCWGYIWWNPWPTYTTNIWPTLQTKIRMIWKGSHGLKRRFILYILYIHIWASKDVTVFEVRQLHVCRAIAYSKCPLSWAKGGMEQFVWSWMVPGYRKTWKTWYW